jgi:hypothetical protein
MLPGSTFGYEQIVKELIRGVIDTVGTRPGLTPERRDAAQQTIVCSVMAYNPRDPIETMMAGQCVVYDHMLRDGAHDMLRGQAEELKIKARPGILATGKMFLSTLQMLCRMQGRPEQQLAFARPPAEQPEPAATPARTPDEAGYEKPIAARNRPDPGDARTRAETAAPPLVAGNPPATRSTPSARVDVPAPAAVTAIPPTIQRGTPAQATVALAAPSSGLATPGSGVPMRSTQTTAPPVHATAPMVLPEMVDVILFNGIDPVIRQEILASAALAVQGAR